MSGTFLLGRPPEIHAWLPDTSISRYFWNFAAFSSRSFMQRDLTAVLIDDDRDSLEVICHVLSRFHLRVITTRFQDAAEALVYLREHPVDFVTTDLRMPGLDGLGFIREFRKHDHTTPIIVVSSEPEPPKRAMQSGGNAFVPKTRLIARLGPVVEMLISVSPRPRETIQHAHAARPNPTMAPLAGSIARRP